MCFDGHLQGAHACVIWVNRQAITIVTTIACGFGYYSIGLIGLVWLETHSSVCVCVCVRCMRMALGRG